MKKNLCMMGVAALLIGGSNPLLAKVATDGDAPVVIEDTKSYEDFVSQTGNDIIRILVNKDKPMSERKEEFRQVLHSKFDMRAIGKFVMSKHWRGFSQPQREEFLKLFNNAVVENYASQFDNYHNEKLNVKGAYGTPDGGVVVQSVIIRPAGGPPLKVDWKIFQTKVGLKVLDIVVDGVSMSITLRSEYVGVFQSKGGVAGGGIDGLFQYLRDKIENPEQNEKNASGQRKSS